MCLFLAKTTTGLPALWVQTSEFLVFLHWRTFLLEVTERTLIKIQPSNLQVPHLLQVLEALKRRFSQTVLKLSTGKGATTVRICKAHRSAAGAAHLALDVALDTRLAEKVDRLPATAKHAIEREFIETALAILHFPGYNSLPEIILFFFLSFLSFAALDIGLGALLLGSL